MNIEEQRKAFEEFYKTKILTKDYEIEMIDQLTEFHVDTGLYEYVRMQTAWETWIASANREGYKLVPLQPSNETIVAIERVVENQLEASAIDADPFRLDGENIYKAMIGACDD